MNQVQIVFESVHFLFFVVLVNSIQPVLELRFIGRFSDRIVSKSHYLFYILLSFAISAIELELQPAPLSLLILIFRITLLWGFSAAFLKCQAAMALIMAIAAKTVTLLSNGIVAPITILAVSALEETDFIETVAGGFMIGFLGQFITFALIIVNYQIILWKFKWQGRLPSQYLAAFFLPVLMVLIVEQYIFNVYGNEIVTEGAKIIKPFADHWQMFFIQLFACFSLLSTLYTTGRLTKDFSNRTRILLLERETAAQRDYLEESRARDEQTRSFRHDINHHLLALTGLLDQGEMGKAKEYLGKLKNVSETLSFPCKTGNTVVDTVLGGKLSIARQNGVQVECTIKIPSPCTVDDLDLCVLFANAVDNAIHACGDQENGIRFIRISGRQKGNFFMVEIENSCSHGTYKKGIGLGNIEAVSEKYHGAVTTEKQGNCFQLNVLLVISRQVDDISVKSH